MKLREHEIQGMDDVAVLTEFDVHNIFAGGIQALLRECGMDEDTVEQLMDCAGCIDRVVIEPEHPELFEPHLVRKWEVLLNNVIDHIRVLDGLIHDDAEYTC